MTDCNTYISDTGVLYIDSDDRYWADYYDSQPHWAKQQKENNGKGESMADYNIGTYANSSSMVYYDGDMIYTGDSSVHWAGHDGYYYPQRESPPVTVITRIVEVPTPDPQNDRKENDMIERQTFLDALADEGKTITVEEREIIRCADDLKFALLIARLLARVFKSTDLAMLKEKPKEVLITKEA